MDSDKSSQEMSHSLLEGSIDETENLAFVSENNSLTVWFQHKESDVNPITHVYTVTVHTSLTYFSNTATMGQWSNSSSL